MRGAFHALQICNILCMYVGRGVKPTPANPVADQAIEDQQLFRTSIATGAPHPPPMPRVAHAVSGVPFPVLRKHVEGHVTCLGSYIVVDLLERWTGDKSLVRSVAAEGQTDAHAGAVGAKTTAGRGFRFYHAVLQRIGHWHCDGARVAASGSGSNQKSACSGTKRKRRR